MTTRFPKGAEWRIWDLQVHTPFSELNNGFGSDFDQYAAQFFARALKKGVAVVGVTDYFTLQGYRFLKQVQSDSAQLESLIGKHLVEAAQSLLLLPNVELRTDVLVDGNRVNYHVIFSDEVAPDDIEHDFLAQLHFTSEGNPQGVDQRHSLTLRNLEFLGVELKKHHAKFASMSDLFVGMMQATVQHQQVSEVLQRQQQKFGDRYVFCIPCDEDLSKVSWDGQGHMIRKVLLQKSDIFFTSNANTRGFALGQKHASVESYVQEFGSLKPCIHCSDAHKLEELFEPAQDRLTWIKADPTFLGLRQVLNEPDTRVYIGALPPQLQAVRNRATKVVRAIKVHKKPASTLPEKWFSQDLDLNSELVAIIGNKGSGKSALADILGLVGNTPRSESFSFLSPDRFNDRKNNKAKHFEASVLWADGKNDGPVSLDQTPSPQSVESVKYIPQDYLEKICNEVSLGSGSRFYAELQKVIFSHVPEAEQLGYFSLDELLDHRSAETRKTIELLCGELRGINRDLASCEEQLTEEHRKSLDAQLAAKRRELDAIQKPEAKAAPSEDPAALLAAASVSAQLTGLKAQLADVERRIADARQRLNLETRRRTSAERLLSKLLNIEKQVQSGLADALIEARELGINLAEYIRLDIDRTPINVVLQAALSSIAETNAQLAHDSPSGLPAAQTQLTAGIARLNQSLSAPQREYEEYLLALKKWEAERNVVIGAPDQLGTLRQLEDALSRLPTVRARKSDLENARLKKALEIYREKEKLRDDFGRYYGAVQSFLTTHPIAQNQQFKLTFNVAITEKGFTANFLKLLNQRRVGTFSGLEEGGQRLAALCEATNFDSVIETQAFMIAVDQALRHDQRTGKQSAAIELKDQLAQGTSVSDVYDQLFGLGYLEPIYNLRWDDKSIEQLSPGERGNLLLIFYLLIDRDNIPLVIDQPEENLDNNTVFRTLVPCVKEAKTRRQIVMVTHNPNLAIVCDAEQIICAEMHKEDANEVRYVSGSIEDPEINQRIVDILEGTRPAFDKRDAKYWTKASPAS